MSILIRPLTLDQCQQYWLKVQPASQPGPAFLPARFISYQPCPAMIVVELLQGGKPARRVARDDLFIELVGSSTSFQDPSPG